MMPHNCITIIICQTIIHNYSLFLTHVYKMYIEYDILNINIIIISRIYVTHI